MNLWSRILNRVTRYLPLQTKRWIQQYTQSGQYVDEELALTYSTVWACVSIISKSMATLPWCVYQKTKTGRKEATDHPVYWLLHTQPNPEMSPAIFKMTLTAHLITWGNAYCEIERDQMNRPFWLWPITPDRVCVERDADGRIVYRVKNQGGNDSILPAADVLHIRGLGFDGLIGYSVIRMAAQSIGLGVAMRDFGSSFFGNGANLGASLSHPKSLSPEARKHLEDSLQKRAGGKNALKTLVLEEGLKYERIGIPPEEAQFLESRKFETLEICRWYGVPPHKIAALDRATWNNIEHQALEYITDTLQFPITQFEEEVNLKLFGRQQRGLFYTKFNLAALLRGDLKTRYEAYQIAHDRGWLNADEIRELEEMNPIPGGLGKIYLVPSNFTTRELMKAGPVQTSATPPPLNPGDPGYSNLENRLIAALREGRTINTARGK